MGRTYQKDNLLVSTSVALLIGMILVAIYFTFAFTRAGRLVIDSTRIRLRTLMGLPDEGRIRLDDDREGSH